MNQADHHNLYKAYDSLRHFVFNIDEEDRTTELMEAFTSLCALVSAEDARYKTRRQNLLKKIQAKTLQLDPEFNSFMKKLAS